MASENESLKVGDREAFEKWMNREPTWVDYNSDARYMAWEAALEYERSRHRIPPAQAEPVKFVVCEVCKMEVKFCNCENRKARQSKPTYAEVTNWPAGAVADITAALDRKVEPVKEWVPVAGEKVLVEAELIGMSSLIEDGIVVCDNSTGYPWTNATIDESKLTPKGRKP